MATQTHGCSTRNNIYRGNSDDKVVETLSKKYANFLEYRLLFKREWEDTHSRKSINPFVPSAMFSRSRKACIGNKWVKKKKREFHHLPIREMLSKKC